MRRPDLFWIPFFCYGFGILWLHEYKGLFDWVSGLAIFFLSAFGIGTWFLKKPSWLLWALVGIFFFFLGGGFGISQIGFSETDIEFQPLGKQTLSGTLQNVQQGEKDGKRYLQGRVILSERIEKNKSIPATGQVNFWLQPISADDAEQWHDGLGVSVTGDLRIREQYRNPGPWLTWEEKSGRGVFRSIKPLEDSAAFRWNPVYDQKITGWAAEVRKSFIRGMAKVMPEKDLQLLRGLLFGGQEGVSAEIRKSFAVTGMTHILSVSGTHLAALFAGILWLGRILRMKRIWIGSIGILVISFYSLLCAFPPPVVRSLFMSLGVIVALIAERERSGQRIFAMTLLGMLIWEPRWIFDISFQLSATATMGLMIALPYLEERKTWKNFWRGPIIFTLGAQLLSLPFMAAYFQEISIISFLSNLFLLPLFESSLILGLLGSGFSYFHEGIAQFFWILSSLSLGASLEGIRFFSKVPFALLPLPSMDFWSGLCYYCGIIIFSAGIRWGKTNKKAFSISAFGVILMVSAFYIPFYPVESEELEIHVLDVGQGDSILIKTPDHKVILIDTGGIPGANNDFNIGERVVAPYLWRLGIRKLELLIISHGDEDHMGGSKEILKRIPAKEIWIPASAAGYFDEKKEQLRIPLEGENREFGKISVRVIAQPPVKEKSWSQIIEISYGEHRFLFTGDLEGKEEKVLLEKGKLGKITGLKVGHHGAKNGSSFELLNQIQPEFAVISVGEANRFGHPTIQTLGRLKSVGSKVYRTDLQGRILIRSDGNQYRIETMSRQEKSNEYH